MPIYESEEITRDKLEEIRKRNVCAVCGGWLNTFLDAESGKIFIACHEWLRSGHQGIERESSRYEKEGLSSLNIPTRRRIMEQEYGKETTTALDKARLPSTGALTQSQAMHILKLVYPGVPEPEIIRCAILCRDFGLHPLMKEVYLIPFETKKGTQWATVLGIGATRKLVAQRGTYSYVGNTPRVMKEQEQMDIFGKVSSTEILAITKLKTKDGMEAQGYGRISKTGTFQGEDKGNTRENMAFIRSERNAFGRLFTDAIPQGIDVIDEAYVDVPDVGKVDKATGEIIEPADMVEGEFSEVKEKPAPEPTHWCQKHNCAFTKKNKFGKDYWSHPDSSSPTGWCNEIKKKKKEGVSHATADEPVLEPEPEPEPEPPPEEPVIGTLQELQETMALCNWSYTDVGRFCNSERGWGIKAFGDLTPEQLAEVIDHIKKNAK